MLTEERHTAILKILDGKKAATVTELAKELDASESTIRRDLSALHQAGKLCKVYGGATSLDGNYSTKEEDIVEKRDSHREDKARIAKSAAELIERGDFVYLDAGTTTERMIDYLADCGAIYVTNGIMHAHKLAARGCKVFILNGQVKASTAAVTGAGAVESLRHYNFTKGFFGVNGVSVKAGFSTPDAGEGLVKIEALSRCKKAYVLADPSKFNKIAPITFAELSAAAILTTAPPDKKYRDHATIVEVN